MRHLQQNLLLSHRIHVNCVKNAAFYKHMLHFLQPLRKCCADLVSMRQLQQNLLLSHRIHVNCVKNATEGIFKLSKNQLLSKYRIENS
jgi:hypothetical protein